MTGLQTLKHRLPKGWEKLLGLGGVVSSPLEVLVKEGKLPRTYEHWKDPAGLKANTQQQ